MVAPSTPRAAADLQDRDDPFVSEGRRPPLPDWKTRGFWMGWRLRVLTLVAVAACLAMLWFIRSVAAWPVLDEKIYVAPDASLGIETLAGHRYAIRALDDAQGRWLPIDALMTDQSSRWIVDDHRRTLHAQMHDALGAAISQGPVTWTLADERTFTSQPHPLGVRRLGLLFWLMSALALGLFLSVMVVNLARPDRRNALHALVALPQVGNVLYIAAQSAADVYIPSGFSSAEFALRSSFDLVSVTALAHAMSLHPRPLPWRRWLGPVLWVVTALLVAALLAGAVPKAWWVTQAMAVSLGGLVLAQLLWSSRRDPHPISITLVRFGLVVWVAFILLTAAIGLTSDAQGALKVAREIGAVVWVLTFASAILASPFLTKPHAAMREFSLVAGVSTMATALDVLFITVFSIAPFASLALSTVLALMAYAATRQWVLSRMLHSNVLTTERMFDRLYRIARDTEQHPENVLNNLGDLLRDLYDPIDLVVQNGGAPRSSIVGGGSTLVVPIPLRRHEAAADPPRQSICLRYAQRGRRLFTPDDARLTDRVVEQLSRALAFDQAVERGRREERERIAQDLHDDIGARLLTMMYQAPTPEAEDYIRHTIHELKTLTRGLAARDHRLSHAIAEWKADIAQRLNVAQGTLDWTFEHDHDPMLTVGQWSALTRILRELVTNALAHGHATHVSVRASLRGAALHLRFADNGIGVEPHAWSHGLGMGGIRKRVKQLQGTVRWTPRDPKGIVCFVDVLLEPPASP